MLVQRCADRLERLVEPEDLVLTLLDAAPDRLHLAIGSLPLAGVARLGALLARSRESFVPCRDLVGLRCAQALCFLGLLPLLLEQRFETGHICPHVLELGGDLLQLDIELIRRCIDFRELRQCH